jgi:hypothetical protein
MSNYFDKGYSSSATGTVTSADIYDVVTRPGVFMICSDDKNYAILSSCTEVGNIGVPYNTDIAYVVYPGWGFTLYPDSGQTGSNISNTYHNTTNAVQFYYCGDGSGFDISKGKQIKLTNNINVYGGMVINSIKIYYRGAQINIPGFITN